MSGPEAAPREADDDDEGPSDGRNFAIGAAGLVGLRALRDHGGKRLSQMGIESWCSVATETAICCATTRP